MRAARLCRGLPGDWEQRHSGKGNPRTRGQRGQREAAAGGGGGPGGRSEGQGLTHEGAEGHHAEQPLEEDAEAVHQGPVLAATVAGRRRGGGGGAAVAADRQRAGLGRDDAGGAGGVGAPHSGPSAPLSGCAGGEGIRTLRSTSGKREGVPRAALLRL